MQIQFHKNGKQALNLQIITKHRLKIKENILIRSCVIYSLFLLKGIDNIMIVSQDKKSTRSWLYITTTEIDTKVLVCHAILSRHVVRELLKITYNILPHQKSKKHRAEKALGNLIVCKFSMTRVAFLPYTRLYIQQLMFQPDTHIVHQLY